MTQPFPTALLACASMPRIHPRALGPAQPRLGPCASLIAALILCIANCGPARATSSAPAYLQAWQQKLEQSAFSGTVLIAKAGSVIYHRGFGQSDRSSQRAVDAYTVFDIGSLTKQFTATATMLLVEQGKLSLEAPLGSYFPNVPADKQAITVHQLLSHASGLPAGLPGRALYDQVEAGQVSTEILAQPLIARPGERYHYSNIGYSLLAQIIERVSGQEWEHFIRHNILLPAGLRETGYRLLAVPQARLAINYGADPNWLQRQLRMKPDSRSVGDSLQHLRQSPGRRWFEGAGGFLSTAQDMHAWSVAMSRGQILSPSSWAQMFKPHIAENAEKSAYYGYGWLLVRTESGSPRVTHSGSNGYSYATFDYYPDQQLFIFTASNDIDNYPYPLMKELNQLLLRSRP